MWRVTSGGPCTKNPQHPQFPYQTLKKGRGLRSPASSRSIDKVPWPTKHEGDCCKIFDSTLICQTSLILEVTFFASGVVVCLICQNPKRCYKLPWSSVSLTLPAAPMVPVRTDKSWAMCLGGPQPDSGVCWESPFEMFDSSLWALCPSSSFLRIKKKKEKVLIHM